MKYEVKQKIPDGRVITMPVNTKYRSVRVRVKNFRNCTFVFEHPGKKYPTAFPCPVCKMYHTHKAYHLHLDSNGETAVSQELYQKMRESRIAEEVVGVKEVVPRPQAIGMPHVDGHGRVIPFDKPNPQAPQPPNVVSQRLGLIKSNGMSLPVIGGSNG